MVAGNQFSNMKFKVKVLPAGEYLSEIFTRQQDARNAILQIKFEAMRNKVYTRWLSRYECLINDQTFSVVRHHEK